MKKKHFILMLVISLLAITRNAVAQKDSSGIYKTAGDFQERKLSYAINYKNEKHKIKDDILFNDKIIVVKHKGGTYTLLKSDTYGYRNTKGEEFRFIDNKQYKILNPGEYLLMYVYQPPSYPPKAAAKYAPTYFFSVGAFSLPQPLTIINLKKTFPNNHAFHDMLDENFKSDPELIRYDDFHKMYKLSRIYKSIME